LKGVIMKNKKCLNCGGVIDYKKWCKKILHPTDWLWNHKKFCDWDCCKDYNYNKKKEE